MNKTLLALFVLALAAGSFATADAKPRGPEFKEEEATTQEETVATKEQPEEELGKIEPAAGPAEETVDPTKRRQFKNH